PRIAVQRREPRTRRLVLERDRDAGARPSRSAGRDRCVAERCLVGRDQRRLGRRHAGQLGRHARPLRAARRSLVNEGKLSAVL
ncbi:hypothetical protein IWW54_005536, partial [Coemansia sp. RSA 2705]